jgi:hypothetical protein
MGGLGGGGPDGAPPLPDVASSMRCRIAESTILLRSNAWKSAYAS